MDKEEYFSRSLEYFESIRESVGESIKRLGSFESNNIESIFWKLWRIELHTKEVKEQLSFIILILLVLLIIFIIAVIHFW